ncbi:MAG TPA: PilZ domain-containing protein [Anaeromyxobacteraceae bacterium]|nr:PilZ domain-containing protein [Anaeromyxobacteraceae bacterium]
MADPSRPGATGHPAEEDRRDSKRVPVRLLVRDLTVGGSFEEQDGNVGLGGVYFAKGHPPPGNRVEVRVLLPGTRSEIRATGEIVQVNPEGGGFGAHVRFANLALEDELALARFLDRS